MNSSLRSRLDRHFTTASALVAAAAIGGAVRPAEAAIVYSGVVNINIPSTTAGVYLNVVTTVNDPVPGNVPGWDVNPWSSGTLSFYNPTAPAGGVYASATTGGAPLNLAAGTLIDGTSLYGAGAPTTFVLNSSNNLVGFRFQNEANGNQIHYGWMRISVSGTLVAQPRAIVEYAYEDQAGVGIAAGTTSSAAQGACCYQDGTCTPNLTGAACTATPGAVFNGAADCASANCPPAGACCKPDGSCANITAGACAGLSGIWTAATACASITCPQPGACCLPSGCSPTLIQQAPCTAQGGTWAGSGVTCATANCPQPCGTVTDALPAGPNSGWPVTYGSASNRITRDGVVSTCAVPHIPGNNGAQTCAYAKYDYMNSSASTQCVTVTMTPACIDMLVTAHVGAYDPANPTATCVGSPGNSPAANTPVTFSFDVPASSPFSIVVNECTTGAGCGYSFSMFGGGVLNCNNAVGACCFFAGTCTPNMSLANCVAAGGSFSGAADCATANCPVTGACCKPAGTCAELTSAGCASAGGTWNGAAPCASANCPPPGACCIGGFCSSLTQAACVAQTGVWSAQTCAAAVCPGGYTENGDAGDLPVIAQIPTGGGGLFLINGTLTAGVNDVDMYMIQICDSAAFSATTVGLTTMDTQLFLFDANGLGVWTNDDSTGLQSTLPVGSAATDGVYYLAINGYNVDPQSSGGAIFTTVSGPADGPGAAFPVSGWLGTTGYSGAYGIKLTGACFPSATGICCFDDGTCQPNMTTGACSAAGGHFGFAADCASANCPPAGRCCNPDATCSMITQAACAQHGGVFTAGSTCAAACPTGRCCKPDATCAVLTVQACATAGGIYGGDTTICDVPCSGACCQLDGTCAVIAPGACAAGVGLYAGDGSACATANCPHVYTYGGAPVVIADGTCTSTNQYAELTVADTFAIQQADAAFYITHTYQGDLVLTLTHVETGTSVVLENRPSLGAGGGAYGADNFGASAAVPFRDIDSAPSKYQTPPVVAGGIANVSGFWQPDNPLSVFGGETSAGTWRLMGQDCAGGDTGTIVMFKLSLRAPAAAVCYANCDHSTQPPVLNVQDFTCFLTKYVGGDAYANCDNSTQPPVLNVQDFTCFLTKYVAGCP